MVIHQIRCLTSLVFFSLQTPTFAWDSAYSKWGLQKKNIGFSAPAGWLTSIRIGADLFPVEIYASQIILPGSVGILLLCHPGR